MAARASNFLQTAIEQLAVPGIMIGHRFILPGDEHALLPEDASGSAKSRQASGAVIEITQFLSFCSYQLMKLTEIFPGGEPWPTRVADEMMLVDDIAGDSP